METKQILVEKFINGDCEDENGDSEALTSGAFEAIKFVCAACTTDTSRTALLNIKCDEVDGIKYLIGTDGRRMHILQTEDPSLTPGKCYAWREYYGCIILTEIDARFPEQWVDQFKLDCEPVTPIGDYIFAQYLADLLFPIARHSPEMPRIDHEFLFPLLGCRWKIKVAKGGAPYIFERVGETKATAIIMPLRG